MISVTIDSPNPDIGPQWDDLVRRANSNVFMNPAALTAAAELNFARIQVLLAWEEGGDGRKLVGVWALQSRRPVPFWPMLLEALPYNYAFLSSPVVDPACVDEVIAAFFAAIEKSPSLPKVAQPAIARRGVSELSRDIEGTGQARHRAPDAFGRRPAVRDPGVRRQTIRLDAQEAAAGLEAGCRRSAPSTS